MRPDIFRPLVSFDEARACALALARPVRRTEVVTIETCLDRVAAEDVFAAHDVPAFDRSAMDGYAVRSADIQYAAAQATVTLTCVGDVFAGEMPTRPLGAGECVAVGTGAPLPPGSDAVVMVEQTRREGLRVELRASIEPGQNVGRRGADLMSGSSVVRVGETMTPGRIGAMAAVGVRTIRVFARPRIAVISTGNEVVEPGESLPAGHVYNVNRYTLQAVIRAHGCDPMPGGLAGDSLEQVTAMLDSASEADAIVCSGGSSVGGRDLLVDVVQAFGRVQVHGVAIKPGKPTLLGDFRGVPTFGMPGNPASCLSNAYLLLVPFLRRLARLPDWRPTRVQVPLAQRLRPSNNRHQFYTVRLENGLAIPAFKTSSSITSIANADGYIEIPAGSDDIEEGRTVTVTLWR